jgi:hypothetical protein
MSRKVAWVKSAWVIGPLRKRALAIFLGLLFLGCASDPVITPTGDVELANDPGITLFYDRAMGFYTALNNRRVNSFMTYQDEFLRAAFRDHGQFSDYYAQLAESLREYRFERNEPLFVEVEEFFIDGPGRARARVHFRGDNSYPLRWWTVSHIREDRWEREGDEWWIVPGKL